MGCSTAKYWIIRPEKSKQLRDRALTHPTQSTLRRGAVSRSLNTGVWSDGFRNTPLDMECRLEGIRPTKRTESGSLRGLVAKEGNFRVDDSGGEQSQAGCAPNSTNKHMRSVLRAGGGVFHSWAGAGSPVRITQGGKPGAAKSLVQGGTVSQRGARLLALTKHYRPPAGAAPTRPDLR